MVLKRHLLAATLALAIAVAQVSTAVAAPRSQDTGTGEIVSVVVQTDTNGTTIVLTYKDSQGVTQTVNLTVDEAVALNLVTVGTDGTVTVIASPGDPIDLGTIPTKKNPCDMPEGSNQPVGAALAGFFCGSLGVDYKTISGWHTDGYGFGVIAQALFMAQILGGDSTLAEEILAAKKSGDYSKLGLPEGVSITNWGQFRKFVLSAEVKSLTNLGAIMSGRAQPLALTTTPTGSTTDLTGKWLHGKGKGKSGDHGNNGNHGKSGTHGKGK